MRIIHILITHTLNVLFPVVCITCGQAGAYICHACFEKLKKAERDTEKPFFAVFQYKDKTIRALLWSLKYSGNANAARLCAESMYGEFCEELRDQAMCKGFTNPLIIPIPLSPPRMRERGFNQAELIAKEFAALDSSFTLSADVLKKIKDIKSQTSIKNRAEREKNIIGCFSVTSPGKIKHKNIILIDDIYTTGATLNEAKKILVNAGARMVLCYTVAH